MCSQNFIEHATRVRTRLMRAERWGRRSHNRIVELAWWWETLVCAVVYGFAFVVGDAFSPPSMEQLANDVSRSRA